MSMRKQGTDIAGLERLLSNVPPHIIEQTPRLKRAAEILKAIKDGHLPPLSASSLDMWDIYDIFELQMKWDDDFTSAVKLYEVPHELETLFKNSMAVMIHNVPNSAITRVFLLDLIATCLLKEREIAQSTTLTTASLTTPSASTAQSSASNPPPASMVSETKSAKLVLCLETVFKQEVKYKGSWHVLKGLAAYSFGYGTMENYGNLVVAKAKRIMYMSEVYGELLASMAMMHRACQREEMEDATVFGAATDGFEYCFWRIDNASMVTKSKVYNWHHVSDRPYIYSAFRSIIRFALSCTPSSPSAKSELLVQSLEDDSREETESEVSGEWPEFVDESDSDVNIVHMG